MAATRTGWVRTAVASAVALASTLVSGPPTATATTAITTAADPIERAIILSPYDGPARYSNESPAQHHTAQGDWAVDLFRNEADVYPHIVGATGQATLIFLSDQKACGTTGRYVTVAVKVDDVFVGTVSYYHLNTAGVTFPESGVKIPSGFRLGRTHLWTPSYQLTGTPPFQDLCWNVSGPSGVHTHFTAYRGSCFAEIEGGTTVEPDDPIGALSSEWRGGRHTRQPCTADDLRIDPGQPVDPGLACGGVIDCLQNHPRYGNAGGRAGSVVRLYAAVFLRIPDDAGFNYWVGLDLGVDAMADEFMASQEFRLRYGTLSDAAFVDLLYSNVLLREGDPAGVAYWNEMLRTHRRRDAVLAFSESAEFRIRTNTR